MTEQQLIAHWADARRHIILAQLGPIVLLTSIVGLLQFGLADATLTVRLAAVGILLATGVLGAAAQIAAATEGRAVARDLAELPAVSAPGRSIAALGPWTMLVRVGTPAIFLVIFALLLVALLIPGAA